jgi:predicted enzyme related to lactoylglutathione lyase
MAKIVHFEIPVDDAERASAFYREALGWEVSGFGTQPYWLVTAGHDDEPGANGALIGRGEVHRSPVLIVGVDQIDEAVQKVVRAGGHLVQDELAIPGVGWSAYFRDTEGNTIGLFQPDSGAQQGN